ncbi:MAG: hypothetical protein AAFR47_00695 [Pseudomonadota bacterium]
MTFKFVSALAAIVALASPVAAATVQFDFRAQDPGDFSFGPDIAFTQGGINLNVSGVSSIVGAGPELGRYSDGLGVGNGNEANGIVSPGRARIGLAESVLLEFTELVTLQELQVFERSRGEPQSFQLFVDGVDQGSFSFDGRNGEPQTISLGDGFTGESFQLIGTDPDVTDGDNADRQGFGLVTAAVEMAPIPVGPAAPLLGSALLLLVLRARRKRS